MVDRVIRVIIDPGESQSGGQQVRRELEGIQRAGTTAQNTVNRTGDALTQRLAAAGNSIRRTGRQVRRGAQDAQQGLRGINLEARAVDATARFLRRSLLSLVAGFGIRQLQQVADSYQLIQNRLRIVTESSEELARVTNDVFRVAQDTRSAFESTAELYARVARSSEQLGLSQERLINFTETVSQAIQVSGATAQEASAGVIQFAQGLASGRLSGDELRSVLEQLPRLARALADGLGVSIGELRELGEEGRLTADRVIGAIEASAGEINREFREVNVTIGAAFTQLGNSITRTTGRLDDAIGVTNRFTEAIRDLSRGIEILGTQSGSVENLELRIQATREQLGRFIEANAQIPSITGEVQIDRARRQLAALEQQLGEIRDPIQELLSQTGPNPFNNISAVTDPLLESARIFNSELKIISETRAELEENLFREAEDAVRDEERQRERRIRQIEREQRELERAAEARRDFTQGLEDVRNILQLQVDLGEDAAGAIELYTTRVQAAQLGTGEFVEEAVRLQEEINLLNADLERTAEIRANQEADRELISNLEFELFLLSQSSEEIERQTALRELSINATDKERERVRGLVDDIRRATEELEQREEAIRGFSEILSSAAGDVVTDFRSLPDIIDNVEQSIINLITQLLIVEPLARSIRDAITGATSGGAGGAGGSGFTRLLGGFFNLFPGFQSGFDGVISGVGGTDSQLVAFRGTPGERVTVTPQGQAGPQDQRPIQIILEGVQDADSFLRNRGAITAAAFRAGQAANRRNN